jgi:hypothetical protein
VRPRPPIHEWLIHWIDEETDPVESLDSLPGVFWHLSDAWSRRETQHVVFVHYDDLLNELGTQMHGLAESLQIVVPDETWPALSEAATFSNMRSQASSLIPDPSGILKDQRAFFRRGSSGAAAEILTARELEHYESRAAEMAPPDLLEWLHHGSGVRTPS